MGRRKKRQARSILEPFLVSQDEPLLPRQMFIVSHRDKKGNTYREYRLTTLKEIKCPACEAGIPKRPA